MGFFGKGSAKANDITTMDVMRMNRRQRRAFGSVNHTKFPGTTKPIFKKKIDK